MFNSIKPRLVLAFLAFALLAALIFILYFALVLNPSLSVKATVLHLIIIGLFLCVGAFFAGLWVSSGIIRPVRELSRLFAGISTGNTGQRAMEMKDDEIGELMHAFNKMAERLEDTVKELTDERDRMDLVLSRMGDGIIVVDGESNITAVNRASEHIFNFDAGRVTGQSFIEALRDYELELPVRHCLKTRKTQQEYLDLQSRGLYLGLVVTPLFSQPGCLILIQDLSRLKQLETIRKDFVANVSRELRTPISSIKLLAETLNDGAVNDAQVSLDFIQRIHSEVEKLGQIVDGMSTLARIESGQAKLVKKPMDLKVLINKVFERLKPQVEPRQLEFVLHVEPAGIVVPADPSQLEQVLYNIFTMLPSLHAATPSSKFRQAFRAKTVWWSPVIQAKASIRLIYHEFLNVFILQKNPAPAGAPGLAWQSQGIL